MGPVARSMYLESVYVGEVYKIIQSFKNKTTRNTKIEALKIDNSSYDFTSTIELVIDQSFQQGVFPEQMKMTKVVQIHKDGSKTEVVNYRPISMLTAFS